MLGLVRRSFHHKKALAEDDQLAERVMDVGEMMQGHWKDVDLELLAELDNKNVSQQSSYSTNARIRSLMEAHKKEKDGGIKVDLSHMTSDEIQFMKETERHDILVQRERDIASKSFDSYEAFLASDVAGESPADVDADNDTLLATSSEEGDAKLEEGADDDESSGILKVPDFYDPRLNQKPTAKDDAEVPSQPQDESSGVYVLPKTDPSKWGTEDVIAWLEAFGEEGLMEEHMKEAFRMVKVDGEMLLMKVSPPDLFKVMRKWHVQRSNEKTRDIAGQLVVDTQLVNNTIYLCYPYCR